MFTGAERVHRQKVYKEQMLYRTRRDIPSNYFLEVLLVTDNTLINFHGKDNVQQYLLAMINIVSKTTGCYSLQSKPFQKIYGSSGKTY